MTHSSCERYMKAQQAAIERNKRKAEKAAQEAAELRKRLSVLTPDREKQKNESFD